MRTRLWSTIVVLALATMLGELEARAGGSDLGRRYAAQRQRERKVSRTVASSRKSIRSSRARRKPGLGAVYARRRAASGDRVAEYNDNAGRNRPARRAVARDRFGNAEGGDNDLARDGAFRGKEIAVLQLYDGWPIENPRFDFEAPRQALEEKGFSVHRWTQVPPIDEMMRVLNRSSQLWIISSPGNGTLTWQGAFGQLSHQPYSNGPDFGPKQVAAVRDFFQRGRGLYLWGDNVPFYHEANLMARELFDTEMEGLVNADQQVGVQRAPGEPGLEPDHLLTTGLEHLYEGVTVATIRPSPLLRPLIIGSEGNLVAAYHDGGGRRAIVDGGFTRLYVNWDTAGTARYIKNAAAWLANAERFER